MPGDNVTIDVELIYPVAINKNLRFAIREGGRTVGAGQVVEIIELNIQVQEVLNLHYPACPYNGTRV
jgi:hypothetical protein